MNLVNGSSAEPPGISPMPVPINLGMTPVSGVADGQTVRKVLLSVQTHVGQFFFFLEVDGAIDFGTALVGLARSMKEGGGIIVPKPKLPPDLEGRL